jgi:putative nucleotidyltransferase with HDIG domain
MSTLLNRDEYIKVTDEVMGYMSIPTQPKIISEIRQEVNHPNANLERITELVSKDVNMSAKLLKTVNSAFYGLREKVDSIHRAISLIGMKSFNNLIVTAFLQEALGGKGQDIERFWSHSMTAASFASQIARKVGYHSVDQAYLAGLFHDCGVPVLLKTFPEYAEIMDQALSVVPVESLSGRSKSIIGLEHERFRTHHCAIGYLVAKNWKAPDEVLDVIWHHHYVKISIHKDPSTRQLASIILLADYMSSSLMTVAGGAFAVDEESEWAQMHAEVMKELSMNLDNVLDLKGGLSF